MTWKKERQKLACKFKKALGLKDFKLAMKIAKFQLDYNGQAPEISKLLDLEFGEPKYYEGCDCCGDYSYSWKGHKDFYIVLQYGRFKIE